MRRILPHQKPVKRDSTPGLIYLIGLLAYGAWGGWAYLLVTRPPGDLQNQILFLSAFFLAIFFTGLFLFYQIYHAATGKTSRVIFYPAVRRGFFLALFFLALGAMRLLEIMTVLNVFLLGTILLLLEIQLNRRNG